MSEQSVKQVEYRGAVIQVLGAIALAVAAFKMGEFYGRSSTQCGESKTHLLELNVLYEDAVAEHGTASPLAQYLKQDIIEATAQLRSSCMTDYQDIEDTLQQRFHL